MRSSNKVLVFSFQETAVPDSTVLRVRLSPTPAATCAWPVTTVPRGREHLPPAPWEPSQTHLGTPTCPTVKHAPQVRLHSKCQLAFQGNHFLWEQSSTHWVNSRVHCFFSRERFQSTYSAEFNFKFTVLTESSCEICIDCGICLNAYLCV